MCFLEARSWTEWRPLRLVRGFWSGWPVITGTPAVLRLLVLGLIGAIYGYKPSPLLRLVDLFWSAERERDREKERIQIRALKVSVSDDYGYGESIPVHPGPLPTLPSLFLNVRLHENTHGQVDIVHSTQKRRKCIQKKKRGTPRIPFYSPAKRPPTRAIPIIPFYIVHSARIKISKFRIEINKKVHRLVRRLPHIRVNRSAESCKTGTSQHRGLRASLGA